MVAERAFLILSIFLELQLFYDLRKGLPEEVSEALKKIISTINCEQNEESENDQYKKYSVFEDLQDGNKHSMIYQFDGVIVS